MLKKFLSVSLLILAGTAVFAQEEKPALRAALPTPAQVEFLKMEREMFIHFGPATFEGNEGGQAAIPTERINPTQLDTDQWCETALSWGAGQIVFVAKHGDGFCWWQTNTTDYGIKETPYKDGKGDVLSELSASCKKYGLKLGLYIAPCDVHLGAGLGGITNDPARQEEYTALYRQQLTEILSRYGKISEVWFDGSCKIDVSDILAKYTPDAMIFQGPQATLRWPGNESGYVPYPAWQTVSAEDAATGTATADQSDPNGEVWLPMECDTPLLDHKWFWAPGTDSMIKSLDHLVSMYETSAGRGSILLLNATPDSTGLIPASHAARYKEFGEELNRLYGTPVQEILNPNSNALELTFSKPTPVSRTVLEEKIAEGMRIRRYQIEGMVGGEWKYLVKNGESVGNKRIDKFDTAEVTKLRVTVLESAGEPIILRFAAFH